MAATERELERAAYLLLKMTTDQREELFKSLHVCGRCFSTECSGWCDYQTPNY
jgi:hypothetical protein